MKNNGAQLGRIYGRFSSKPQERGDSKRRQIEGATQYAQKNGIKIVGEPYFDEGISGKNGLNLEKEFGRLLKDSSEGDVILCEALDRIGRQNPFVLGKLVWDTVQKGITVIAFQEGKVVSKDNIDKLDTQFSVFTGAAVGHADNRRKIDRLRETTQNALKEAAKGIQNGTLKRNLPRCFVWNEDSKTITISDEKAAVIRKIFEMYAAGNGTTKIAKHLNETNTPTIYAKTRFWEETSISLILKTEAYAGTTTLQGQKFSNIPKVVDRDLFDKVQLMLSRNKHRHGNYTGKVNNIFSGVGVCKYCGGSLRAHMNAPRKTTHSTTYFYSCMNARMKKCSTPHKMINADLIELVFFSEFFGGSPENSFGNNQRKELQTKIDALNNRIKTLDTAIEGLYDMAEAGDKTAKTRIEARKSEKNQLETELTQLRGAVVEDQNIPTMMDELDAVFTDPEGDTLLETFIPKLRKKLSNNDNRKKIVNILPSLFQKITVDFINHTIQPFTKDGTPLKSVDIDSIKDCAGF